MEGLSDLRIGEIGASKQVEITDALMALSVDLTMDMTTEMRFRVYDKDFQMFKHNYFQIRRPLSYNGFNYEVAAVTLNRSGGQHDSIEVTARSMPIQRMRRQKGYKTWGAGGAGITAAQCAKEIAEEFGLEMFIQSSPAKTAITRQQSDTSSESTWDVLRRLAGELEYVVFESYGVLYFTSEDYLIERQPGIAVDLDAEEQDPWFPFSLSFRQSDDDWKGSEFSLQVDRENGKKLRPGMTAEFKNIGLLSDRKHLITNVTWDEGTNQPVGIKGRTLKETEDTAANTDVGLGRYGAVIPLGSRNLLLGMVGKDVERVQRILQMTEVNAEGVAFYGTRTIEAMQQWQKDNGLAIKTITNVSDMDAGERRDLRLGVSQITTYVADGLVDADDWAKLLGVATSDRKYIHASDAVPPFLTQSDGQVDTSGAEAISVKYLITDDRARRYIQ
jgi:hypothetical protein